MIFKVWRSEREGVGGRYETYDVKTARGMNVLEALFQIQDRFDAGLAFRYSCRGAVCGSCAMMINREIRLACRTQVDMIGRYKPMGLASFPPLEREVGWNKGSEVLIEPLPNLPILKDLVVDMERFYRHYKSVRPFIEHVEREEKTAVIGPKRTEQLDKWANCILCAACYGSCPVCNKNDRYQGPHALAWSLRFVDDPRTADETSDRLALVKHPDGVPACEWFYNCVRVCPKNVAPAAAIRTLKKKLEP